MAHILIADDDDALRGLMADSLRRDGHTCEQASNGAEAEAVLAASSTKLSVLVTDLEMPGIDGVALAKRAADHNPHIRVLLVSGFAELLDAASGIAAERVDKLAKPFKLEDLRARVAALLA